jgi:GR25 family glycosyltransferase involved in LPS biosynthesis
MKVFVTNLKTSPDRRAHMIKEFEGKGVEYTFVDCVIGKDLTEEELNEKCDMDKINHFNKDGEWFTKGVIGATLTNHNNCKRLLDSNDKTAMFIEDDTTLPDNLKEILDEIEHKALPGDLILLFYLTYSTLKLKPVDNSKVARFFIPVNPEVIHGGSAVIYTRESAKGTLEYNTPIKMSPDSWKFFLEKNCIKRLICLHPQPIDTADFGSTLDYVKDSFIKRLLHSNPITRFALKLRRKLRKALRRKIVVVNE